MEDLLDELHQLRMIELGKSLTDKQSNRYLEIVEILQRNNIEIPFGIDI